MVLSGDTINQIRPFDPFEPESKRAFGLSYGLSHAGYDVRLAEAIWLPPKGFRLASTLERFVMPNDCIAVVHDKSTNIRQGIAVHNTVVEPSWCGYLTLEISNQSWRFHRLQAGYPIAQIIFHKLDWPARGYSGKYQNQERGPQVARFEK